MCAWPPPSTLLDRRGPSGTHLSDTVPFGRPHTSAPCTAQAMGTAQTFERLRHVRSLGGRRIGVVAAARKGVALPGERC